METPSPEMKRINLLSRLVTPKSLARRKLMNNSPAFRAITDISELSMSPLQLLDSPVQPMTPSTSSEETSGRKSPFMKQTSTPSDDIMQDTPSNKNKAFIVASNAFVAIKAKRRLIEEDKNISPLKENAAKKQKTSQHKPVFKSAKNKKGSGHINSGVSHRIRMPEKKIKKSTLSISLSDLKKAKAEGIVKNPLDPVSKPETPSPKREAEEVFTQLVKPQVKEVMKLQSPIVSNKKQISISPRSITRNWNQRYRKDNKERKFFKSREAHSPNRIVTVSVNDNLKLQIHERPLRKSPRKLMPEPVVDAKIDILHQDWDEDHPDMDISTNIQDILNGLSDEEEPAPKDIEEKENVAKLFPLFYKDAIKAQEVAPAAKKVNLKSQWIRARNDGENQMMLDAGQKAYGAVQCPECMMVYHLKEPEDELLHAKIHDSLKDNLKFTGWKKERMVRKFDNGCIISVHHGDPAHCWKKVHSVLKNVVDHELGFSEIGIRNPESTKVYLYITEKKIAGVLVAENVQKGYRMLLPGATGSGKCCSSDPAPAVCGISRIWTLASFRRHKIATRLLDAMRSDFIYGKILDIDELAFSDPTENGQAFAQSYAKRYDFLVYNM